MNQGTLKSYIFGFIASIVLTLVAFYAVTDPGFFHLAGSVAILATILALAVIQLVIQLVSFLDLGFGFGGSSERWKFMTLLSTIALVLIIVIGSIWIMNHLNYNMTPAQVNQYMQDQQGGF